MNTQNDSLTPNANSHGKSNFLLAGAGLLVAAGFGWQAVRTSNLEKQIADGNQQKAALQARLDQTDTAWQSAMRGVQQDLDKTKERGETIVVQADLTAKRRADAAIRKQLAGNQQVAEQLNQMKNSNEAATAKLDGISNEVGSVKNEVGSVKNEVGSVKSDVGIVRTDVESTKTDLRDARAELLRVRGDLGEVSGLVATNSKQIQFLRDLGDRNIFEFTLARDANQHVGDIQLTLQKADVKRGRFSVDVMADDRHVQKKDRTVNEPVQFYVTKSKQPYELVINSVQKDKVSGYLATPKVNVSRNNAEVK